MFRKINLKKTSKINYNLFNKFLFNNKIIFIFEKFINLQIIFYNLVNFNFYKNFFYFYLTIVNGLGLNNSFFFLLQLIFTKTTDYKYKLTSNQIINLKFNYFFLIYCKYYEFLLYYKFISYFFYFINKFSELFFIFFLKKIINLFFFYGYIKSINQKSS